MIRPGGWFFLFSFSQDKARPEAGVFLQRLYGAFSDGWEIKSVQSVSGEVNSIFTAGFPDECPEGDSNMLFAIYAGNPEGLH